VRPTSWEKPRPAGWALVVVSIVALGTSALAVSAAPAVAKGSPNSEGRRVFDVVYRGSGEFAYESRESDNAGCSRTMKGRGEFAFDNEWHMTAAVNGGTLKFTRVDHLSGPGQRGGGSGENNVKLSGDVGNHNGVPGACQNPGSFDCVGGNLIPESLPGADMLVTGTGSPRLTFLPQGLYRYSGALTGPDSVPTPDGSSCDIFKRDLPSPFSGFTPTDDAWGKVPVKAATLAGLKRGHYFKVDVQLGHHTIGSLGKYGKGCLGVEDHDPYDFCTVETDQFGGTFSLRRVR
jgi:hypothetical protein